MSRISEVLRKCDEEKDSVGALKGRFYGGASELSDDEIKRLYDSADKENDYDFKEEVGKEMTKRKIETK